jgi:hypothetical protein
MAFPIFIVWRVSVVYDRQLVSRGHSFEDFTPYTIDQAHYERIGYQLDEVCLRSIPKYNTQPKLSIKNSSVF